jgi:hypothetical protein
MLNINQMIMSPSIPAKIQKPLAVAPQYAQPLPAPSTTNIYRIAKYMGLSPQNASNQIKKNCQAELAKAYVPIKGSLGFGDSPQYAYCKAGKRDRLAEAKAKLANPGIPHTIDLSRPIPVTSASLYQGEISAGGSRKKNNKSKK